MLNFYIVTTIIVFIASILASLRISIYIKSMNRKVKKKSFEEKILGYGQWIFMSVLPIINILFGLTYIYMLIADDEALGKIDSIRKMTEPR